MNASDIIAALDELAPPKEMRDYPAYAEKRDGLVAAVRERIEAGERLGPEHRESLERAIAHAQLALTVLQAEHDRILTDRERVRAVRRKLAEHVQSGQAVRIDLNA
ncbi:MAG: hypothetical protein AAFU77_06160 [Myxococcota bacterium]